VRAVLASLAAVTLLAAASGCDGKGTASTQPLSERAFADKVAAAIITGSDLQAARGFGTKLKVDVSAPTTLSTFSIPLDKPFADYSANRDRLDPILASLVKEAQTRMSRGNSTESFADVRSQILPVLKPETMLRKLTDRPATASFPGHLRVVYAVQRADAFTVIRPADLERWHRPLAEINRIALENLLRETHRTQRLKCEEKLCGWASGDGYDAARMLVPELRAEIVREIGTAVYAVPRESVYVALPIKLAGRIRDRVVHDFVTAENPVSPDLFVERGGKLVVLPK
jgi:uncharacterized protein YtpQ (UPF0354 family)